MKKAELEKINELLNLRLDALSTNNGSLSEQNKLLWEQNEQLRQQYNVMLEWATTENKELETINDENERLRKVLKTRNEQMTELIGVVKDTSLTAKKAHHNGLISIDYAMMSIEALNILQERMMQANLIKSNFLKMDMKVIKATRKAAQEKSIALRKELSLLEK